MDDDELMSPQQRQLLAAVVGALNRGEDPFATAARIRPAPPEGDVAAALRILDLPGVDFEIGESVAVVGGRILDLLEALMDERY